MKREIAVEGVHSCRPLCALWDLGGSLQAHKGGALARCRFSFIGRTC